MRRGIVRIDEVAPVDASWRAPELAIVVPILNERDNIRELVGRLGRALRGIAWEVVFVDDDSRDGTHEVLLDLQRRYPHVRSLQRIGRRGLSSASIEGMLATSAPFVAVMDGDLQHDEKLLPTMLSALKEDGLDIVVGSRFTDGGSTGQLSSRRRLLSRAGNALGRIISRADLSDPMSGFFVLRREFLDETVHRLSGEGFKILLDLFASAPRPVRFAELPFYFRSRHRGTSKLDTLVMLEYIKLLADKMLGRYLPVRFVIFVLVGCLGIMVHLSLLGLFFRAFDLSFFSAQVIATLIAMTVNFNLNNALTYRDRRLRGPALIYGHLSFYAICSIGAIANLQVAQLLFEHRVPWAIAGLLGAVVGAVWNYGVSSTLTWQKPAAS